jgi:hypothetical protein
MLNRFLTFVLLGVLSLTALEGFEARSEKRESKPGSPAVTTTDAPSDVRAKDDGNPWPPRAF